jgi:membrane dipeptidase
LKTILKRMLIIVTTLAAIRVFLTRLIAPMIDRMLNRVAAKPPNKVSTETAVFHQQLFIADLHSDPYLWNRDLAQRHSYGHIDLPRLREGNVALQTVGVAAKIPWGLNFERNPGRSDMLAALVVAQNWPLRTWYNQYQRALHHAERLHALIARDPNNSLLIRSPQDLDTLVLRRQKSRAAIGFMLGLEGIHALQGDLTRLDKLYEVGFRLLGLTHFFDNEAGGSAHGWHKGGLTPFGRALIEAAEAKQMTIDLSHASPQLIEDVCAIATRPLVVSHTGVCGTCNTSRNLSDRSIQLVANSGGLIGIAMFDMAVCDTTVGATAEAMRYVADLVGVKHVALGTDFDGAIKAPIDASGLSLLTESLLTLGFSTDETGKIMGENVRRFLHENLPGDS